MMSLSKWLPTRDFGPKIWKSFWRSVPNNANDIRNIEIFQETINLKWSYLGDGKPEGVTKNLMNLGYADNYTFPIAFGQEVMAKTIQGNHRHTNKVQIWIGIMNDGDGFPTPPHKEGFYKIIYDPTSEIHTLSQHDNNANVIWSLGFDEGNHLPPMAINYK